MKYIDYIETRKQGTFNFPIQYYHVTSQAPRYQMQYHWHPHYEIIRIISGSLHLTLDGASQTYRPGDVVFVSGGMLHGGMPQDCIYECIVFDLRILAKDNHACSKALHDIMDHKILIHTYLSLYSQKILPVVKELCHALSSRKTGYEFMVQGYLYHLLGIILEEHLYAENPQDLAATERISSLKNVLSYIAENYSSYICLADLSKVAGMNPRYFCRYFRNMTERTPIDYLNYYRIECACEMLSTKNISIRETAISCGFNDESYFIKTFHKYKGITPKRFIKSNF